MATLNLHLTGYNICYPRGYSALWAADIFDGVVSASVQGSFLKVKRDKSSFRSWQGQVLQTTFYRGVKRILSSVIHISDLLTWLILV